MNLESIFQSILDQSFNKKNKLVSVFDCKCVIIQLFGKNISSKEIISVLCSKCNWKLNNYGINIEQFKILIHHYADQFKNECKDNSNILKYYYHFDQKQKGWISENDFMNQFTSTQQQYRYEPSNLGPVLTTGQVG